MTCTVSRNNKYVDKNELTIENLIRKNIVLTYLSKFDIMKKKKECMMIHFFVGKYQFSVEFPQFYGQKMVQNCWKKMSKCDDSHALVAAYYLWPDP